jgi:hypothetical protein
LVVNEMEREEVSLVSRKGVAGARVARLTDTNKFEERSKLYEPGELWPSYADGNHEAALWDEEPLVSS